MGAWIETYHSLLSYGRDGVAPRVGAWIETSTEKDIDLKEMSLPVWERGLKLTFTHNDDHLPLSLPVWERGLKLQKVMSLVRRWCRSPCGSVD